MPRPPQFLFDFKRTIDYMLSQVGGVSRRDFVRLYDYDDFLEGEALQCKTPRELAIAFAVRFLGSVSPAYFRGIFRLPLVRFLARQSGRSVGDDDKAIKALAYVEPQDLHQLGQWLDAYFPRRAIRIADRTLQNRQISFQPAAFFVINQVQVNIQFLPILRLAPHPRLAMRFIAYCGGRFAIHRFNPFADGLNRILG